MASPTPPILSALILEALKRSGYSNPSADLQARASDRWMEELKEEVWMKTRGLKKLQARAVTNLVKGVFQYGNPADYASDMSMVYATGAHYGAAQSGSTTSATLAASETITAADAVGKEIVFTSGLAAGQISSIQSYDAGTKMAGLSTTLTAAVAASTGYVVLDFYQPLSEEPIWGYSRIINPTEKGIPVNYYPVGTSTNDGFILYPTPWWDDSQPMVAIQRYQADISEADVAGTLMLTLYQKWQGLWVAGLRWKCLQNDDDDRATGAFQEFQKKLRDISGAGTYGNTINELQARVVDY